MISPNCHKYPFFYWMSTGFMKPSSKWVLIKKDNPGGYLPLYRIPPDEYTELNGQGQR